MPSLFPGMDPFLEKTGIFHELHTQMLAAAQGQLQPQIRPKYVARLERHLSEGSVWGMEVGSLARKEPDVTLLEAGGDGPLPESRAEVSSPTCVGVQELEEDEQQLRKQRRIVIYVDDTPRQAVTTIELLSPTNKEPGSIGLDRYMEKRNSALHGGLHWVEIDVLRGGVRPPVSIEHPASDYSAYIAKATQLGWEHRVYCWGIREALPTLPIPLLGDDEAALDLAECFRQAYDRTAADTEAGYAKNPPPPPLTDADAEWVDGLLRTSGWRTE